MTGVTGNGCISRAQPAVQPSVREDLCSVAVGATPWGGNTSNLYNCGPPGHPRRSFRRKANLQYIFHAGDKRQGIIFLCMTN